MIVMGRSVPATGKTDYVEKYGATKLNGRMAQRGRGLHLVVRPDSLLLAPWLSLYASETWSGRVSPSKIGINLDTRQGLSVWYKIGKPMFNGRMKIAFLVLLGCLLSACAQIKEAGRTVGHTTRDVTREIGHGTRDAAKAVGEGVKKVAKSATEDDK
jgi:hypothetical protein